jgi:hypothetical protein
LHMLTNALRSHPIASPKQTLAPASWLMIGVRLSDNSHRKNTR